MVAGDESGGWSSASPADLEEYVNRVDSMRGYFNSACERAEALWLEELPRNDFVDFASPFGDAENMMTTWKNRTEFVTDVRQAFIDADSYDPDEPGVVITVPTSEVTATVGRSAEALEALGVSPEDAEKIAAGSPELFDAVINGRISVDAALEVAELTPTEQRNVLSTDLGSDEIVEVLDGDHGDDAKTALIEGHGYRVRLLMLDEEARSAILAGDALAIVLGDDKHVSFEELNKRVRDGREEIVAAYEEAELSPEEAAAVYDDLVASLDYLGENDDARDTLDGSADDDSKPGDPDADNKFSIADAQTRAIELLEDNEDSNSQRLWQTALQGQLGSPSIRVEVTDADRQVAQELIDEHDYLNPHPRDREPIRLDSGALASKVQALRVTDPEAAARLEFAIIQQLDEPERSLFIGVLARQNRQASQANAVLGEGIEGDVEVDQVEVGSETERILDQATSTTSNRGGGTRTHVDLNEIEYQINELAKENPALALVVKAQLDQELTPAQVAELNRLIVDPNFDDNINSAGNHPIQGIEGGAKNFTNGLIFVANWLDDPLDNPFNGVDGPIDYFELENSAQRGGATIGDAVEIVVGGKGIVKIVGQGGAKVVVKTFVENGREFAIVNGKKIALAGRELVISGKNVVVNGVEIGARGARYIWHNGKRIFVKNADDAARTADDLPPASSAAQGQRLKERLIATEEAQPTVASGQPGGIPKVSPGLVDEGTGKRVKPSDRGTELEYDSADRLADEGLDVEQLPDDKAKRTPDEDQRIRDAQERAGLDPTKDPDYLIEGRIADGYSPEANTPLKKIRNNISGKAANKQADRIVVNMTDSKYSAADVLAELNKNPPSRVKEVIILDETGTSVRWSNPDLVNP